MQKTEFYKNLIDKRKDSPELRDCMEKTVADLSSYPTEYARPGMLLGKIQSGKTRAFLGVLALAFDEGFDVGIILTKGTKALVEQTMQRLNEDYKEFIENDEIQIHDIMHFPTNLTSWELNQKLVIVAKKEINNMKRIIKVLDETYPDLKNKKLLIIDDEADYASISFRKDNESGDVELGKIAQKINDLRERVAKCDFLQVTATPYSLYLQPQEESSENSTMIYKPMRPRFTELVPIHSSYIGGDFYFGESMNENSTAYHLYEEVNVEEREILKKPDRRRFRVEEVLSSKAISILRKAIINFIVGGTIRQLHQESFNIKIEKYSFIIHTERTKTAHDWQEEIANRLEEELIKEAEKDTGIFRKLIKESYIDLKESIELEGIQIPDLEEITNKVKENLLKDYVVAIRVNSDNDVKQLLDSKGQLKLRTPLNIFIGGQILDRGITIQNLIGFYYGRNPQSFQQDTVLQHSRMYGSRSKHDLAVTRFYTTRHIYEIMHKINEFDEALRNEFLIGSQDKGVYFIRKDGKNRLVPCSPNKILLSKVTTLRPYKRLLPVGFQTGYKSNIIRKILEIDGLINNIEENVEEKKGGFLIDLPLATQLITNIEPSLEFENGFKWDYQAAKAAIEHASKITTDDPFHKGKVWLIIRKNNNLSRRKDDNRFSDDPDGGSGSGSARNVARELAIDIPALIMTRQNGLEDRGWRGSPFWWPIILMPKNTPTSIFAEETIDE